MVGKADCKRLPDTLTTVRGPAAGSNEVENSHCVLRLA